MVDGFEIIYEFLAVTGRDILHGISDLMNDASLDLHGRKDILDGGGKSRESVDTGDANILDSAILEIVADLLPEGSRFRISDIESEYFFHTSRIDSKHEVDSFRFDSSIFLHFEVDGIKVDDRIEAIKHSALPLLDIWKDLVSDVTYEIS